MIRRARRGGREAGGNEEREKRERMRKGAFVSSSPQGMTSWSSSIKIWFFQANRLMRNRIQKYVPLVNRKPNVIY